MPGNGFEPIPLSRPDPKSRECTREILLSPLEDCATRINTYLRVHKNTGTQWHPKPMARIAPLLPTLVKSRKAQGKAPWCLSVPAHLSSTGQRQRLFYPTKSAANLDADKLAARRDNFGVSLTAMSPARIAEAAEAYNLLEGTGVRLLDVVRTGLAMHKAAWNRFPSWICLINTLMRKRLVTRNT